MRIAFPVAVLLSLVLSPLSLMGAPASGAKPVGAKSVGAKSTEAKADADVTVKQEPPTSKVVEFKPGAPPEDVDLADESALCRFYFKVHLDYKFRFNQRPMRDGVAVRLFGLVFTYTVNLEQTIYLPTNADEKLTDHEQGHRRIAEAVYANAEKMAREVAADVKAEQWQATGATQKEAAQKATDAMFAEALKGFVDRLTEEVQRLNDDYDELTDHGRNGIPVDGAVKKILSVNGYAEPAETGGSTKPTS